MADEVHSAPAEPAAVPLLAAAVFEQARTEVLCRPRPVSTYRLQLHRGFPLPKAAEVLGYLSQLGVSDVYLSPCLAAVPGSAHGYDVIDHRRLNPELGSDEDFDAFCASAASFGLGRLLDFVPNHMGIGPYNPAWFDVLENGTASPFARFFDIDWAPVKEELRGKVLLPILGDQYGVVLERGELQLEHRRGAFFVRYFDTLLPLAPRQYARLLAYRLEALAERLGSNDPSFIELQSILTALSHLPPRSETAPARLLERAREKEVIKRRLAAVVEASPWVESHVEGNVRRFNGTVGDARSFDLLDEVLNGCSYRLAHWRVAGEEINYRRFFDINALAAVRVEDPAVFAHVHQHVLEWLADGRVTGLRVDHPDGLFDPTAYFVSLQEAHFLAVARVACARLGQLARWEELLPLVRDRYRAEAGPERPLGRALYLVLEKIQGGRERIPPTWAVHGTTGYRFAHSLTGLWIDRRARRAFDSLYERFTGRRLEFGQLVAEKKRLVLSSSMASELNVLARDLNRISEMSRRTRDFTLNSLRKALVEFAAYFPVYRTYLDGRPEGPDGRDRQYIEWTLARAKQERTLNPTVFDFLGDVLLGRVGSWASEAERAAMLRFTQKLQQLTGPVMAKGLEDTAFYVYNRFVALNEVGGEPERFGVPVATFHRRNQERARAWPASLLMTSTHDTKRSEDVRARLCALSEMPEAFAERVVAWAELNARHRRWTGTTFAPESNDEYLFYQTVLGVWPMGGISDEEQRQLLVGRLRDYMLKAVREAKVHTSWVNPVPAYEDGVTGFVDRSLDPASSPDFFAQVAAFAQLLERPGQLSSLSQVLLKVASPGTADVYQGSELWDLSLVDPDNRRPVDFALRQRLLDELDREVARDRLALCRTLTAQMSDGRVKLYVLAQALRVRRAWPEVFRGGGYRPLSLRGPRAANVVSFARQSSGRFAVVLAPRLLVGLLDPQGMLGEALGGTTVALPPELHGASLEERFTGRRFEVGPGAELDCGELLRDFPLALLTLEAEPGAEIPVALPSRGV